MKSVFGIVILCMVVSTAPATAATECFIHGGYVYVLGSPGSGPGQFSGPMGLCGAYEYIFIADTGNNRIQRWTIPSFAFDLSWGTPGSAEGSFDRPTDVAGWGDNIFVVDSGNNRIQVFDHNGAFKRAWGTPGSGDGQFLNPGSIALDVINRNVYVTDSGNHRVQRFTSEGQYLGAWGSEGSGDGQFIDPSGICVPASGLNEVYVVDRSVGRVQVFTLDGSFKRSFGSGALNQPAGVWADGYEGAEIYISDTGNDRLIAFEGDGESVYCELGGHAFSDFVAESPQGGSLYCGVDSVNSQFVFALVPDPVEKTTWSGLKTRYVDR